MDERRDLVDREELRRRLEENFSESNTHAWVGAHRSVLSHLDAMPAVEWTRGWTRDEVLAELDADPDAVCKVQNPLIGEWGRVSRHSVSRWHPEVRRYDVRVVRVAPEPEWVPLHKLARGMVLDGETVPVHDWGTALGMPGSFEWWPEGGEHLSKSLIVRDDGQVAVRPKGEA